MAEFPIVDLTVELQPSPEHQRRMGDGRLGPCQCRGKGRLFGGFAVCVYGMRAWKAEMLEEIAGIDAKLAEAELGWPNG